MTRTATHLARPHAFTLLEVMVVVSLVSILVALAVPGLSPVLAHTQLDGDTETVASFLANARTAALLDRRCVRVTRPDPRTLVAQRLNTYDCENPTASPVHIDGGTTTWLELDRMKLGRFTTVEFEHAPADSPGELRYRSTGRLFSSNSTINNDDAVLVVTHSRLPAPRNARRVLAESHGPICVLSRGQAVPGSAGNFACP